MFSNSETHVVSFPSNWEQTRESTDGCSQTFPVSTSDQNDQTTFYKNTEVQTEHVEKFSSPPSFDETALAEFLGRTCPKVLEELDKIQRSKAFAAYRLPDDDGEQDVQKLFTLFKPRDAADPLMKVSSMSWSCTGSVVALSFSCTQHDDWCSHCSGVHLYNVDRNNFNGAVPTRILETSSCVRSVSMHPYEPSVIAAGTYSGEVILWNLLNEDMDILGSSGKDGHSESVTQIQWVTQSTGTSLVSAGLDSLLVMWKVSLQTSTFRLSDRYVLTNSDSGSEPGITCFAFSPRKQGVFVAAVEGGQLFNCSVDTAKPTTRVDITASIKDPVIGPLNGHVGAVTSLAFSPYHDDIFASVGTDLQIRIYSLRQSSAIRVIWCETETVGIAWSGSQANIVAAWGSNWSIYLYDSNTGQKVTTLQPDENEQDSSKPLTVAVFNNKSPKLLAVGDLAGVGYIWKIPLHFQITKPDRTD